MIKGLWVVVSEYGGLRFVEERGPKPWFNWARKLLGRPLVQQETQFVGIEFFMGKLGQGRGYEEIAAFRASAANLVADIRGLNLSSNDLRRLVVQAEQEMRGLFRVTWQQKVLHELRQLETHLLLLETSAANPGKSVSIGLGFVEVS